MVPCSGSGFEHAWELRVAGDDAGPTGRAHDDGSTDTEATEPVSSVHEDLVRSREPAYDPRAVLTPFQTLHRRTGARYPLVAVAVQVGQAHLVVFVAVVFLRLYVPLDTADWWLLVAITQVAVELENGALLASARRALRPARPWLRGTDRGPEAAAAAWRALTGLPVRLASGWVVLRAVAGMIGSSVIVVALVGDPWWPALPATLAGTGVVIVYVSLLRYLVLEISMRPVLREISDDLADVTELPRTTISLRTRLFIALPAINVITGVLVAGLSGADGLTGLGIAVLGALAVSLSAASILSLLLVRSFLEPLRLLERGAQTVIDGDLSHRVPIVGGDEAGRLSVTFNRAVAGLEERRRLHEALGAYVDPVLADRIASEGSQLAGEDVEVTVLFVDVRDFTTFAERADAREVVSFLDRFYEVVVPLISRHGGHVDGFVGDGLLAVFGAPVPLRDHADAGLAAAIAIVGAVRTAFDGDVEVGVGVNSGPVVAGTMGGGGRVAFTVIGDTVNTASRVEGITGETGDPVLLTGQTRDLLTRDFGGFDHRHQVRVKGKRDPLELYVPRAVLTGERSQRAPGPLVLLGRLMAPSGRARRG